MVRQAASTPDTSMKDEFSPIYFDGQPIKLLGDEARPPLSRIVRAGGQVPGRVDVQVLASLKDVSGHVLPPGEVIDRTVQPSKPIYLRSVPRATPEAEAAPKGDAVINQLGTAPRYLTKAKPVEPAGTDAPAAEAEAFLAVAEAAAEERQEETREQEGQAQEDDEEEDDAREDRAAAD
jgi:hypothetical protein